MMSSKSVLLENIRKSGLMELNSEVLETGSFESKIGVNKCRAGPSVWGGHSSDELLVANEISARYFKV